MPQTFAFVSFVVKNKNIAVWSPTVY